MRPTAIEIWLALLVASMIAIVCLAAAPVPPFAPPGIPDLSGPCQFGLITQRGENLFVEGPSWSAEMRIVGATVEATWQQGERLAWARYKIDGKRLVGTWQWIESSDPPHDETIEIREKIESRP